MSVQPAPDELPEISPWGYAIALLVTAFLAILSRKDRERFLKALEVGCALMASEGRVVSIRGGSPAVETRNRILAANWVRAMIPVWIRLAKLVEE